MGASLLDYTDQPRTLVCIVGTERLSVAGREMELAFNVIIKRLKTLERRTAAHLMTFA